MSAKAAVATAPRALACDPLSVDDILQGLYRPEPARPARSGVVTRDRLPNREETLAAEHIGDGEPTAEKKPRPTHYKVVCISLYNEDDALSANLSIEVAVEGSATPLTGDQLWAEFITPSGTISVPFVYTSTFDETGSDVPAGSASWTGLTAPVWKGKLEIPVDVILAGELRVRVVCTVPDAGLALYVDPQIRVN